MEIVTSWEKKGRAIGLQEGLQRGIQQGLQREMELLIRQVTRRFKLARKTEKRIRALPIEQVEVLAEDFLDFTDSAELIQWLDQHE